MAATTDVQVHHVLQFTRNVEQLLQQEGMKLPGYCTKGAYTGKAGAVVDQVGTVGIVRDRSRLSDTPYVSVPADRRWIYPHTHTTAVLVDGKDASRALIDMRSAYTQAVVSALGRASDDEIGAMFYGSAMTGEQGATSVSFPSTQAIGVNVGGTNSGLNVPKLRAAKRLLMAAGVDLSRERAYCAITAVEHDNLLGELQVVNMDYNEKPVLADGRVQSFLGFEFVHVEWQATQTDGTTAQYPLSLATIAPGGLSSATRYIPVWVPSGMHYGLWDGLESRADPLPNKNYATQIWAEQLVGATRVQEKKIVQIACYGA